jgi:predicted house-cleaning noncanonical NTP pyrophosphatase (MazG superfamily)
MAGKKLIRDKIPQIMKEKGDIAKTYIADEAEYKLMLNQKLQEEANEYRRDENMEELADVLEVVYAIAKFRGVSMEEVERIRKEKAEKRGSFDKRIVLEGIEKGS